MKWRALREELVIVALIATILALPNLLQPLSTCVIGDARLWRGGIVPPAMRSVRLDAQKMKLGLGAAAIDHWNNLGDALVVGGAVWLRVTDRNAPDFYGLARSRYFLSSSFSYVPIDSTPRALRRPERTARLFETWKDLARSFPAGIVVSGYVRFEELHLIAITAPAIDGKSVEADAAFYYTEPMESARGVWTYLVALVASDSAKPPTQTSDRARLNTPVKSKKLARAHALRLRRAPADFSTPPRSEDVVAVGEIVDDSLVTDGLLELFPVGRVRECHDAYVGGGG